MIVVRQYMFGVNRIQYKELSSDSSFIYIIYLNIFMKFESLYIVKRKLNTIEMESV